MQVKRAVFVRLLDQRGSVVPEAETDAPAVEPPHGVAEEQAPSPVTAATAVEQPATPDTDALRDSLFDQVIANGVTEPVPIWYSKIRRMLEQKLSDRQLPAQVQAMLKGPGMRPDDVKWSGLPQWLQAQPQNQKLTKQQVLDAFDLNRIPITETLQGPRQWTPMWFSPEKARSFWTLSVAALMFSLSCEPLRRRRRSHNCTRQLTTRTRDPAKPPSRSHQL